jgi:hypothetical protein
MLSLKPFRNLTLAAAVAFPGSLALNAPAQAGLQNFTMRNNTRTTIERVYISTNNDENWGPDRLGQTQVIRAGASHRFNFTGFDECVFDIKVVFADNTNSEKRNVNLCQISTFNVNLPTGNADVTAPPSPPVPGRAAAGTPVARNGLQDFTMRNNTRTTIERVYISAASDTNWGDDRLGRTQTIPAGASHRFNFTGFSECVFDIKVVFADGDESEKRNVDLCRIGTFNVNE